MDLGREQKGGTREERGRPGGAGEGRGPGEPVAGVLRIGEPVAGVLRIGGGASTSLDLERVEEAALGLVLEVVEEGARAAVELEVAPEGLVELALRRHRDAGEEPARRELARAVRGPAVEARGALLVARPVAPGLGTRLDRRGLELPAEAVERAAAPRVAARERRLPGQVPARHAPARPARRRQALKGRELLREGRVQRPRGLLGDGPAVVLEQPRPGRVVRVGREPALHIQPEHGRRALAPERVPEVRGLVEAQRARERDVRVAEVVVRAAHGRRGDGLAHAGLDGVGAPQRLGHGAPERAAHFCHVHGLRVPFRVRELRGRLPLRVQVREHLEHVLVEEAAVEVGPAMPTSSAKTATRADDRASPPWSTVSQDLMKTLRYACARSASTRRASLRNAVDCVGLLC
mmetsp:Transcript_22279/g.76760  ORF Transcript_22279/g.76760 Transcript_22279/m.76760 type:complete len:406 (+) Transcript_22279:30-1247(+)